MSRWGLAGLACTHSATYAGYNASSFIGRVPWNVETCCLEIQQLFIVARATEIDKLNVKTAGTQWKETQ